MPSHYDPLDRSRGGIEVRARSGELRRFPIMTVSLGIVLATVRRFTSPAELASVAAEMKNVAKAVDSSSWCIDRRGA